MAFLVPDKKGDEDKGPGRPCAFNIRYVDDKNPLIWRMFGMVVAQVVGFWGFLSLHPKVLMCDCTSAAFQGLEGVLGYMLLLWCNFHAIKSWRTCITVGGKDN